MVENVCLLNALLVFYNVLIITVNFLSMLQFGLSSTVLYHSSVVCFCLHQTICPLPYNYS